MIFITAKTAGGCTPKPPKNLKHLHKIHGTGFRIRLRSLVAIKESMDALSYLRHRSEEEVIGKRVIKKVLFDHVKISLEENEQT